MMPDLKTKGCVCPQVMLKTVLDKLIYLINNSSVTVDKVIELFKSHVVFKGIHKFLNNLRNDYVPNY